ncbi:MAG: hypothetical protein IGR80_12720 [Synechococcales cyanobacterium K44_A2020_017]|jgi:hypothetical protein|uniref:hypothetical protein n=1 Tax=Leptolyngbya sp. CCY15150 TaxID=2767772 RepID=UPI00194DD994|nr:hypothetical protein [Leptolyngbya sp. CCY15150]MBF2090106.1 hypothetical protein [Synechococcales cyanobacterium K32_A2020_035]MBF2095608.1 hypothetical protein [Synechococcales cyanobacterium K44_A2020_017]
MQAKTIWQLGSSNPDNANHFAEISDWWADLHDQDISWKQRLIQPTHDLHNLNWEPQRFDETFRVTHPQVRGITLYWQKSKVEGERNITPQRLELDNLRQELYIYPKTQNEVVIQVALPEVVYQVIELKFPQTGVTHDLDKTVLTLKDESQRVVVKAILSPNTISQLKQHLNEPK